MRARADPAVRWLGLLLAGLALAGCGTKTVTVTVTSHELRLRLEEYRFVPQNVSVPPGRLKIVAYNAGALTHNVVIEVTRGSAGGGADIRAVIPTVLPGQTGTPIKVNLPPGRYTMVSTIANQADLGMTGTLTVRAQ